MSLIFMIYILQLADKIHNLNFESELLDRRSLTTKCRATLLSIRVKVIRWFLLNNKVWQSLQYLFSQNRSFLKLFVQMIFDFRVSNFRNFCCCSFDWKKSLHSSHSSVDFVFSKYLQIQLLYFRVEWLILLH